MIINGDCLIVLKSLKENSVDACVCDPPYGLNFMGKEWDNPSMLGQKAHNDNMHGILAYGGTHTRGYADCDNSQFQKWCYEWAKEVLRVLKPGGHLLAFGGSRTFHRLACAIEDAGFEIRDQIMWVHGQGFPKSNNVSKAIDKMKGAKREVVKRIMVDGNIRNGDCKKGVFNASNNGLMSDINPLTPEAKTWDGWGSALKPAHEPIVLARKPISESTIAKNVLKWKTGGLNIDGSRIGTATEIHTNGKRSMYGGNSLIESKTHNNKTESINHGRFPANLIHDGSEEVVKLFPNSKTGSIKPFKQKTKAGFNTCKQTVNYFTGDSGSAARFFKSCPPDSKIVYCAKVSKAERNMGCENNTHPTLKPLSLMRYLITLITPPNGTVLDPFMGSGSTGIAARQLGFEFIGVEKEEEYYVIAQKRIDSVKDNGLALKEEKQPIKDNGLALKVKQPTLWDD